MAQPGRLRRPGRGLKKSEIQSRANQSIASNTKIQTLPREGELASLAIASPATELSDLPIDLSQDQIDALVELSEADAYAAFFEDSLPEMCPDPTTMLPSQWHAQLESILALTRSYGVSRMEDKVALIRASQLTNAACLEDPRTQSMLQSGLWNERGMMGALFDVGVLS